MLVPSCRCGARQYPDMEAARAAEPDGSFKCPTCWTFASDHECSCSEDSDGRCWWCDTRHGSHGAPRRCEHREPRIDGDRIVCATCAAPVTVRTAPDMDSAWLEAI